MNKLKKLLTIQYLKYQEKGIVNICIALSLLALIIVGAHKIGKMLWVQDISDKALFVAGVSFCLHLCLQTIYFLIYVPGYYFKYTYYEKHKINKGIPKPWENNKNWPQTRTRLFTFLGINYLIVYPVMVLLSTQIAGIKIRFHDFPQISEICWQLIFITFVEDTFFYWAHKLSHQIKFLYKFHKVHHQYAEVFTLVTEYFHPLDYLIGVLIPSSVPFMILGGRVHCFMFFFWQVWKMFISTQGHSGYEFPWSPSRIFFFISGPSFHDFHHSRNVGNYCGVVYLWDFFNDSSDQYWNRRFPQLKGLKND